MTSIYDVMLSTERLLAGAEDGNLGCQGCVGHGLLCAWVVDVVCKEYSDGASMFLQTLVCRNRHFIMM